MGQTRYQSKSWVFKNRFSFKVMQHDKEQLYLQYKVCRILYKMVSAPSISQHCLCMQPMLQYPLKNRSSTSVNFHLLFHPCLFPKSSLQSPLTSPSSMLQQFFTPPPFLRTTSPTIYTKNIFPNSTILPIYAASKDLGAMKSCKDWRCFILSLFFFKVCTVITVLTITDSLFLWCIADVANHPIQLLSCPQPIVITSIPY